jgi:hypothetical protein
MLNEATDLQQKLVHRCRGQVAPWMMRRNLGTYSLASASRMLRAKAFHGMHGDAHLEGQHSGRLA